MHYLCVFCGSCVGNQPEYSSMARQLGRAIVQHELGLVYGGGNIGLMGILASTVLEAGGKVIGIMPRQLADQELLHEQITTTHIVETMHERKALMAKLSSGFMTLPGGLGTLEECCEMLTWAQLNIHRKPCGLLNCSEFFDGLLGFLDHQVKEGFLTPENRALVIEAADPESLLALMKPKLSMEEVKSKK